MSKRRLIQRLKWYYPTEKFHTYVTIPVLLFYLLFTNPIRNVVLLSYGLVVCIIILYQGQYYWKLKLDGLKGAYVEQDNNIRFFKKSKRLNSILILFMLPFLLIQLYIQGWSFESNNMFVWGIIANAFAILEHINYYYTQLMIDNKYDIEYLIKNKKLKKASLAKDLIENRI
ncbi:hypothetical protein [Aquimarina pacifica]|uniref:hypothetical protein n=1 Tax=Aquimarina pacifica TaxID=1296415 RepID=UPI0004717BB4|nr:hypothetical protein [Aquimarina pacifica]